MLKGFTLVSIKAKKKRLEKNTYVGKNAGKGAEVRVKRIEAWKKRKCNARKGVANPEGKGCRKEKGLKSVLSMWRKFSTGLLNAITGVSRKG